MPTSTSSPATSPNVDNVANGHVDDDYAAGAAAAEEAATADFKCGVCEEPLASRNDLRKHFQMAHGALVEKFHRCGDCNAVFLSKDFVKSHRKKEHGVESPTKASPAASNAASGTKTNNAAADEFSCNLCSFKFQSRKSLKLHLANVHKGKRVKCFECVVYFTDHSGLKGPIFNCCCCCRP